MDVRPFHVNNTAPEQPKQLEQAVAEMCRDSENVMRKVEAFFSKPENMGKLLPFLHGTSKISLRMIEWFVFVHTMKHTVDWFNDGEYFNVYLGYQAEMEDNKKQRFDPMGRKWRKEKRKNKSGDLVTVKVYHGINFYYNDDDFVVTSVAQLNFFRWFISKGVLDYMIRNYDKLTTPFNLFNIDRKRKKLDAKTAAAAPAPATHATKSSPPMTHKKVRVQAMKKVTKKNVEVYVSFD